MARKVINLRIFGGPGAYNADVAGSEKLVEARGREVSALDLGLPVLVVSQLTFYGDVRKGSRPSRVHAALGETVAPSVEEVYVALESMGMRVERSALGADMQLSFTNDDPFTTLLEFQSALSVVNKVGKVPRGGLECKQEKQGELMLERSTSRARRVVVLAQDEVRRLNQNYTGTEHSLLGLIHEGDGITARTLETMGIPLEAVRAQVTETIREGG